MVTASPATGTLAPGVPPEVADHVAVEFQSPVATEYRVAAFTVFVRSSAMTSIAKSTKLLFEMSKNLIFTY
jgi:hypothetical protein